MKRLLTLLALVAISICSYAYDFEEGGRYYDITSSTKKTASVTFKDKNYNSYSGIVVIPSEVTHNGVTYSVTNIGYAAFKYCNELSYLSIPNSVTSIESSAFSGCSGLTSIAIPNSVTSIGDHAFSNCSGLTSVTIPNSVTSIEEYTFYGCSGLTSVSIPNSVISIGNDAFEGCFSLTNVVIPDSVTSIGDYAFGRCSSLTSVTIPNSVTSIGKYAFDGCSGLTSIAIPNSVTSIGHDAFHRCTSLNSINVEKRNPNYDSRENCNAIIETKTNALIKGCDNSTIPNSVTSIEYDAFSGCSGLTSVTVPNSVTSIGRRAFYECSELKSVTIGNSVTSIGEYAFYKCSSLTTVTIPNSVTSIGEYAFYDCSKLNSVTLGHSVTKIAESTFSGCSNLTSVIIPNSVISIRKQAFYGCSSLSSVTIPSSVINIGERAFNQCSSLTSVRNRAKKPQNIDNPYDLNSYETFSRKGTLHVLKGYKSVYSEAGDWKRFTIEDDLEEIFVEGFIIDVDNQHFDINVGGLRAKATPTNEDADDWNVTWSTTTPSVIMLVPTTGDFMGLTDGVGEIVATANDGGGVVAKAKVYFGSAQPPMIKVSSINITANKLDMEVGEKLTLQATILPTNASQKTITWSSTTPNIVSIDSYGEITALKPGTAIIIATATDGSGVSGICTITVTSADGIDNINADDNSDDCNIYTINGVKVKDDNLPAGIYIKNGKKVFVK